METLVQDDEEEEENEGTRERWNMKHRRQTSEADTATLQVTKGQGKDRNKSY